jgi:hypothetical protein
MQDAIREESAGRAPPECASSKRRSGNLSKTPERIRRAAAFVFRSVVGLNESLGHVLSWSREGSLGQGEGRVHYLCHPRHWNPHRSEGE